MSRQYVDIQMTARAEQNDVGVVLVEGIITASDPWEMGYAIPAKLRKALGDIKDVKRLNIHINSPGGSVIQSMAMRALLLDHSAEEKHVYIEGECASGATMLACIGAKVHMHKGSVYMIHRPSVYASGTAADLDNQAAILRKMEKDVTDIYAKQTGESQEAMLELMDAETWMTAEEAVARGFADDVIDVEARMCADRYKPSDVMMLGYKNPPAPQETCMAAQPRDEPNEQEKHAEDIQMNGGGQLDMEITQLTAEQLMEGNRALYDAIMTTGATKERERLMQIDDIAMEGCEELVRDAKYTEGKMCEPGELAMLMLKQGKAKGTAHLEARREASMQMGRVAATGTPDETKLTEEQEAMMLAQGISQYV